MHGCWGACVVAGGHVWLPGGVHGCQGACVVAGGHAWLQGACMVARGVHGCQGACVVARRVCVVAGRHAWLLGVCMVARRGGMHGCRGEGACMGYDEIRSMSGRYTSYWNALLYCF